LAILRHIVARYTGLVWAMLKPLGSWAVFAIAGIDSAFFGFPLDPMVAGYVYQDRPRFLLYAAMASAGSAVGCIVLYLIGYKGGEVLLEKRISRTKTRRTDSGVQVVRDSQQRRHGARGRLGLTETAEVQFSSCIGPEAGDCSRGWW
jgi:membrane protein YqaA with SNARE-associated domain